jgi:peptidoglycan/LPS O-acetylase OafA/YrhL
LAVLINHATTFKPPDSAAGWANDLGSALFVIARRLWIGVPIFFVISGYCISAAADSARQKNHGLGIYFYRRFRRIFPPYWVVLFISVVAVGLVDYVLMPNAITHSDRADLFRPWWYSPWNWFGNITLTETWRYHFIGDGRALFLGQAWTLCYEEQFYAVTGLLLLLAPRRFFFPATAIVTVLVVITMIVAPPLNIPVEGFFFDGLWIQFALGILIYYQLNYASKRGYWLGVFLFLIGLAYTCLEPAQLLEEKKNWNQSYLAAFVFALTALFLHPKDSQLANSRMLWPFRACGIMCFSLYLVHVPVVCILRASLLHWYPSGDSLNPWITMPVYSAASLLAAFVFYWLIERRFINKSQVSQTKTKGPKA